VIKVGNLASRCFFVVAAAAAVVVVVVVMLERTRLRLITTHFRLSEFLQKTRTSLKPVS